MFMPLWKLAVAAGLALSLGGCGVTEESNSVSTETSAASQKNVAAKPPPKRPPAVAKKPRAATAAGAATDDKNQEGAKPSDPTKEENESRAEAATPNLVGLEQAQVARILGPPMAETERAPGKVWRYWNSRCVLDVSMYLDIQSRAYRVLSYEVTNHDNSAGGRSACMAELPKSNLQPASYDRR
ncbi:MAG: hypothetical protein AB7R90_09955 [Reyranellaceae bacterium]